MSPSPAIALSWRKQPHPRSFLLPGDSPHQSLVNIGTQLSLIWPIFLPLRHLWRARPTLELPWLQLKLCSYIVAHLLFYLTLPPQVQSPINLLHTNLHVTAWFQQTHLRQVFSRFPQIKKHKGICAHQTWMIGIFYVTSKCHLKVLRSKQEASGDLCHSVSIMMKTG